MSGSNITLSKTRSGSVGNPMNSSTVTSPNSPAKKQRTQSSVSNATTLIAEEDESQTIATDMQGAPPSGQARPIENPHKTDDDHMRTEEHKPEPAEEHTTSNIAPDAETTTEPPKDQPPPVPPRPPNKAQIEEYAMQQDVQEVMGNVFHQLQWAIEPASISQFGNQEDVISDTLWGLITEHSTTVAGKAETATQDFNVIPAYANEPCDIYEALSATFDREVWDERTAYWTVDKAPPILHFQIPRIGFNAEKKIEERNVNQCKLHPRIYLDRFMAGDIILRKRELYWRFRDQLRQRKSSRSRLKPRDREQNVAESLRSVSEYLKGLKDEGDDLQLGLPVDEEHLHESLNAEAKHAESELKRLDDEIAELQDRMDEVFPRDKGQYQYSLQAVFVHRGSTRSGHWYTYMYDARGDKWRKYNDEQVETINAARVKDEIYEPNEAMRGTTALVVYALESQWDRLFDPVHRDPEPEPEPRPSAQWVGDGQQKQVRSQTSELPPANVPYEGASAGEYRAAWDRDREIADSVVKW